MIIKPTPEDQAVLNLQLEFIATDEDGNDIAIISDGRRLPIAMYTDRDGEQTTDMAAVRGILAGSADLGWFDIEIGSLEPMVFH
jgi:hypothetical protein